METGLTGIVAFGAYVPRRRLQRTRVAEAHQWFAPALKAHARGERSMASWDEDAITMAVEAARDAVGEHERAAINTVLLASTSAPFADRQNAGLVKEALNLRDAVMTADLGGSQKAGTAALIQALHTAAAGAGDVLCIASEKPRARPGSESELINGDAAAALRIGSGAPIARLIGSHSTSVDFVDHYRGSDAAYDYGWEARWSRDEGYVALARDALRTALSRHGLRGDEIHRLLVPIPAAGVAETVARAAGIRPEAVGPGLGARLGHAGCAQPLLLLAQALQSAGPGERIALLGFGQGCDVLLFETTAQIASHPRPVGVNGWLSRGVAESNYMKFLAFSGELAMERGMRAEYDQKQPMTALYRNRRAVLGLVGGRDRATGEVQFPKSRIAVGGSAAALDTLDDYPLAERPARVLTYTADHLTYTPDPPGCYGMIEFEGGGRMLAEFTDVDPATLATGMPMRMSFRIKAIDERRDFIKYFWKATPLPSPAGESK
jgi:3-hydroxy-3-methylglutaryl CoA synthase